MHIVTEFSMSDNHFLHTSMQPLDTVYAASWHHNMLLPSHCMATMHLDLVVQSKPLQTSSQMQRL